MEALSGLHHLPPKIDKLLEVFTINSMQRLETIPRQLKTGLILLLAVLLGLYLHGASRADDPPPVSFPNQSYSEADLWRIISRIDGLDGAPGGHGMAMVHRGHLVLVFSNNDGGQGGFAFFDISDPFNPRLVHQQQSSMSRDIREAHAYGFHSTANHDYVVLQATHGIQFWDWRDVQNPQRLSYLELPGVGPRGYSEGAWWVFWQAPYVYVSGAGNGLYIVDASDPRNPHLVKRLNGQPNPLPISQTGGFRLGPVLAVGNLLVGSSMDNPGFVTFDISDPRNPQLLMAGEDNLPEIYSIMVNGNQLLAAGTEGAFSIYDLSDSGEFRFAGEVPIPSRGGYLTVQDGYAHLGASKSYFKIDLQNLRLAGQATSALARRDEDFATVLGNLVVVGDDHGHGSFIIPHQREPDTTGPVVTMTRPANQATNQATTTRIGLTFSDLIDPASLNAETFIVRAVGGRQLSGRYSTQTGIVNFSPDQALQADTVYEIVLPAGGIRDLVGNPISQTFSSTFSTGNGGVALNCRFVPPEPGTVDVAQVFQLNIGGSGSAEVSWDFGDGNRVTTSEARAQHRYTEVGHYTVTANVQRGEQQANCSSRHSVHHPLSTSPARQSGPLLLDEAEQRVWNVNPDNNTVSAGDMQTWRKQLEVPVGQNPQSLAQAADGRIWVVNQDSASISVLNQHTGALEATIALPWASQPHSLVFSPVDEVAFVSLYATGRLLKLDAATLDVLTELDVGPTPRGLGISGDGGRLFVSRFISPDTHGEIVEVDPAGFDIVRRFELAFDSGPDTEAEGRGLPNYLGPAAISPDGTRAWVPSKKDNIARGLNRDGQPLTFDSTVRTIVSQLDLTNNQEDLAARLDLNDRTMAVAATFSPQGDYAFVALQGSQAVEIIDAYRGRVVSGIEHIGFAPQGLALTAAGDRLFVYSYLSRQIAVYDLRGLQGTEAFTPQRLATIETVAAEQLPPQVLQGKQIFFDATDPRFNRDGYLSCAACHLDGGHDGRVWDFTDRGEGLRNTIDLRGRAGTAHGLLHWSGNFDEIQDFEHDLRQPFGGQGFLRDDQFYGSTHYMPLGAAKTGLSPELDALAAYLESLTEVPPSPDRPGPALLSSEAAAGQGAFIAAGCDACHLGPHFTDSPLGRRHDVGTLRESSGQRLGLPLNGLDTPTLKGLWQSAPYLHDGSALTLRDLFAQPAFWSQHARQEPLTPDQVDGLIAYLNQLDESDSLPPSDYIPPRADAGPPQRYIDRNGDGFEMVQLDAARSIDANLLAPRFAWYLQGRPLGFGARTQVLLPVGTHQLKLTITDAYNSRASDLVTVAVAPSPGEYLRDIRFTDNWTAGLDILYPGTRVYHDRPFTFTQVPALVANGLLMRLPNNAKDVDTPNFVGLTTAVSGTLFIAYDARAEAVPTWLGQPWQNTGQMLQTTDGRRQLYALAAAPGQKFVLGGNAAPPVQGLKNHYSIIFVSQVDAVHPALPPQAAAGPPQNRVDFDGDGFETLTLDGRRSSDDGLLRSFNWQITTISTATGAVPLARVDGPNPSVTLPRGQHLAQLTVTDNEGLTATQVTTLSILSPSPLPPQANAGLDQVLTLVPSQSEVQLTLNATLNNEAGDINRYAWYLEGNLLGQEPNLDLTLPPGQHTLRLTVQNAAGLSDSDLVHITVMDPAAAEPTITSDVTTTLRIADIRADSLRPYVLARLGTGETVYSDRSYTFIRMPDVLEGGTFIRPANDDKANANADFLDFSLNLAAEVYIAYDERADIRPDWLRRWQRTDLIIQTSDAFMRVYRRQVDPGVLKLGGNIAEPAPNADLSQYLVIILPLGTD